MKHEKAPTVPRFQAVLTIYDHPLQRNSLEKLMFRKTAVFGHFGQIRPFPVAYSDRICQKAHLHAKTFQMSLFSGLYDHPCQRYSLEKNRWQTDGRRDGQPESIGPQPLGLGPINIIFASVGNRLQDIVLLIWSNNSFICKIIVLIVVTTSFGIINSQMYKPAC